MILKLKKNKLLLFIIITLLLVLISFVFIYLFQDKLGLNIQISSPAKYEELDEYCRVKVVGGYRNIECEAIVESYSTTDDNIECFRLSIINEKFEIKKYEVCESIENFILDGRILSSDLRVPVNIRFAYSGNQITGLTLEKISFEIMDDTRISQLTKGLYDNGESINKIRIQSNIDIVGKGYYTQNPQTLIPSKDILLLTFITVQLKELKVEGGDLFMSFSTRIYDKEISFTLSGREIMYIKNSDEIDNPVRVDISNLSEIDLQKEYFLMMYYINEPESESIKEYCVNNTLEEFTSSFCKNIEGRDISVMEVGIEEYLSSLTSDVEVINNKLIFNTLIANE